MIDNPLISIIIPVYNVEDYITKCLDSVCNQSYPYLEIIIVNDGSTDWSPHIARLFYEKYTNITLINKTNGGLSDARNVGIDNSHGQYIAFVDSDDFISPDMIEYLYHGIIDNEADISVCAFYYTWDHDVSVKRQSSKIVDSKTGLKLLLEDSEVQNYAWNKMYKRELFDTIRYPIGMHFEDAGTTYKLFMKAKTIAILEQPKYYYVQRKGSIVGNNALSSLLDFAIIMQIRQQEIEKVYPEFNCIQFTGYFKLLKDIAIKIKPRKYNSNYELQKIDMMSNYIRQNEKQILSSINVGVKGYILIKLIKKKKYNAIYYICRFYSFLLQSI